jgi:hypothetical protein
MSLPGRHFASAKGDTPIEPIIRAAIGCRKDEPTCDQPNRASHCSHKGRSKDEKDVQDVKDQSIVFGKLRDLQ